MDYSYASVFKNQNELENEIQTKMNFDKNGFLIDKSMAIQKKLEDIYGHVIIKIEPTVRNNIIITFEGNGYILYNPLTKRRMPIIKGNLDYLKATLNALIAEHPYQTPQTILDYCTASCTPEERLKLKEWMKTTWNFQ